MLLTESIFWTGFIFMLRFAKALRISWPQGPWPGDRAGGMMMMAPSSVKGVIMDRTLGWRQPEGTGAIGSGFLVAVVVELAAIIRGAMVA
jgi:hypothetical protein